jgi:hypothetical protein
VFAVSGFVPTLTRGDEVSFPVAIYNYLDTAQTVRVEMLAADWFTPLGGTGMDIDLGPGQVTGVRFPVHVDKVGRQTMTVKGTSATVADAVARSVLRVASHRQRLEHAGAGHRPAGRGPVAGHRHRSRRVRIRESVARGPHW